MLYFMEVGRKCIEMCPFLGCINSHTFLERTKEQRKKPKPSMRKKKPIDNRSLRCCVTFQVLWKYFFQNLKAFHKSSQKHIVFFFLFPFQSKAKFHPCCLSLFFLFSPRKKKKKDFWEFHFSIHCSPGQSKALFYIDVKIFTKIRVSFLYCSN